MFSKLNAIVSILFLVQIMSVQALPEPRTDTTNGCGLEGDPYCPSGYVCCGPYVIDPESGLAHGTCQPQGHICPF
ncbi:hypothetical protein GYMLUDRAFT_89750 [Collybiopsis luxurians FD-317 M1]|nr:hypothetical protein GYMLUDRAFT_89750 [Collybiopsis luxurians FD-317 M1]